MKLGQEKAFEALLQKIGKEALKFPGHQGISILRPEPGAKQPTYPEEILVPLLAKNLGASLLYFEERKEWTE